MHSILTCLYPLSQSHLFHHIPSSLVRQSFVTSPPVVVLIVFPLSLLTSSVRKQTSPLLLLLRYPLNPTKYAFLTMLLHRSTLELSRGHEYTRME